MRRCLKLNLETSSHEELLTSMRCAPTKEGYHVYQGIDFLFQGNSIKETAQLLHVSERTVRYWIHKFNRGGITALAYRGKSGRPRKIPIDKFRAEYLPIVLDPKQVGEDNFTAIKFHSYLQDQHNEQLCYQTLLNYFHENNLSLVVPRPQVTDKQDAEKRLLFIERITELAQNNNEIWFCDEVGFDGDPRPRSRWVKKGSKPVNGRASEHIRFSAIGSINPLSGEMFSLVVPQVDSKVFQVYLDEISKSTDKRPLVLVLDNASWHKAQGLNWHNIMPLYLPPYSPDFNPIENLWRYIKINHFSNWYANNVEMLIEKICSALNSLTTDLIKNCTNPNYLFLKTQ
jgi:transposase